MGCKHYNRNCKLLATCCDNLLSALTLPWWHHIHDHKIDRWPFSELILMPVHVIITFLYFLLALLPQTRHQTRGKTWPFLEYWNNTGLVLLLILFIVADPWWSCAWCATPYNQQDSTANQKNAMELPWASTYTVSWWRGDHECVCARENWRCVCVCVYVCQRGTCVELAT